MSYKERKKIYRDLEKIRETKVLVYVTGDRKGMETQISPEIIDILVDHLDKIGVTQKISLILHTNGGSTSAAWRAVNLIRTFCDELEVIIPHKALSAGTLISIGAERIVMTKQAVLGPIDPSLTHALSPTVAGPAGPVRVPVSVEEVNGYLDGVKGLLDPANGKSDDIAKCLIGVMTSLAQQVNPLVLGQIFRSRKQIRFLAEKLLPNQIGDKQKINDIIDFLTSDSGSHDYTINRREALSLGLNVEKPSDKLYQMLRSIHDNYRDELKLLKPFDLHALSSPQAPVDYNEPRVLIESVAGGSDQYVTEGTLTRISLNGPGMAPQEVVQDERRFDGWRKA
ncbi:hypothetical protein VPG91_06855 [Nitrospirillum amazonense]|uniref:SDH family Clp fold serine proteinase n=1 Tax=Nitrospirillum amazonense TaxID=28077 RepID=UPI002DD42263|nr:hypothetical protein [Nitrospirillum amazonense]MEC4590700.1 hypothetical protein [Nitrospirillum amazonense]